MRVLHVISTLDPDWGGPPVVATRLCAAEAAQGLQVTLMSYDGEAARRSWTNDQETLDGGPQVRMVYVPEEVDSRVSWELVLARSLARSWLIMTWFICMASGRRS